MGAGPTLTTVNVRLGAFAIIGATGGKAFTSNTCIAAEVAWAKAASAPITFYLKLNYPVGSTASEGLQGSYGPAVPNWVVASSGETCGTPIFASGFAWLVQLRAAPPAGTRPVDQLLHAIPG